MDNNLLLQKDLHHPHEKWSYCISPGGYVVPGELIYSSPLFNTYCEGKKRQYINVSNSENRVVKMLYIGAVHPNTEER